MRTLPLLIWIASLYFFSACENPFHDPSLDIDYPDTLVQINSLSPQICEVKISESDSVYNITSYWTDKQTGRIIYKMSYSPYFNSRLHGAQMVFDDKGDTLRLAHFDQGVRIDSTIYRYPNGQIKHKYLYSSKGNGNITYEYNYHPNGVRKSDIIQYNKGLINGAVTYYDDTPRNKPTETYYYVDSEIVGIKIYNDDYESLARRKDAMLAAYQQDSARIALALAEDLANGEGAINDIPVIYFGSKKEAMYDVGDPDLWDILEEDPNFILRMNQLK